MGYRWPYLALISIHGYVMEWWDVLPFSIFCESDQTLGEYGWWWIQANLLSVPPAGTLCRHVQWTAERLLTFTSGWLCVSIWFLLAVLWETTHFSFLLAMITDVYVQLWKTCRPTGCVWSISVGLLTRYTQRGRCPTTSCRRLLSNDRWRVKAPLWHSPK